MTISLDQILVWQHLVVMGAAMGIIEALKASLSKLGLPKQTSKVVHTILPWLPLLLCMGFCAIPGVVQLQVAVADGLVEPQIGLRLVFGLMLGALSGQVWKIIKTKVELLKGKVG